MQTVLGLDDSCQSGVVVPNQTEGVAVPPHCAFGVVQHSVQARLAAAMIPEPLGAQGLSEGRSGHLVIDSEDSIIILAARYLAGRTDANTSWPPPPQQHKNSWKHSEHQWQRKGHSLPAWTYTPKISVRDPEGHERASLVAPILAITLMVVSILSLHVCRVATAHLDDEADLELKAEEAKMKEDFSQVLVPDSRLPERPADAEVRTKPTEVPTKPTEVPTKPAGVLAKPTGKTHGSFFQKLSGMEASDEENPDTEPSPKEALEKQLEGKRVWYFECFRFATAQDFSFILISMVLAAVHGGLMPIAFYKMDRVFQCIYLPNDDGSLPPTMAPHTKRDAAVWHIAKLYIAVAVIVGVARGGSVILMSSVSRRQTRMCRIKIFEVMLRQGPAWHDLLDSAELASRVSTDTFHFQQGVTEHPLNFIRAVTVTTAGLSMAWHKNWKLTILMSLFMPVTLYAISIAAKIVEASSLVTMRDYAKAGAIVETATRMAKTVLAFNGQHLEVEKYRKKLKKAEERGNRLGVVMGFCGGLTSSISSFATCIGVYAGSVWILESLESKCWVSNPPFGKCMTGGSMMGCLFTVMWGFNMGMGTMSECVNGIAMCKSATQRIFAIIDAPPPAERPHCRKLENLAGHLSFENVVFSYPMRPEDRALRGLTLTIPSGNTYALVGPSGSGKSTIVSLILRFYEPTSGRLLLDGEDSRELDPRWMRSRMALVEQEPPLFAGSIYNNIEYGAAGHLPEDRVHHAAKIANAHTFICQLPEGYKTEVGERGAQLSGGQKQRIAIARALVRDPTIMMLDEATSALDSASEKIVQDAMNKLMQDKSRTVIIIAHRLSTVRDADQICVMELGQLIEQGTHKSLLAKGGLYRALAEAQMGACSSDEEKCLDNEKRHASLEESIEQDSNVLNPTVEIQRQESVQSDGSTSNDPALAERQLLELEVEATAAEKKSREDMLKEEFEDLTDVDPEWNSRLWRESRPEYCLYVLGVVFIACTSLVQPWYMMHFGKTMNLFNRPPVVMVPDTGEWAVDFDEAEISTNVSSLCLIMQFSGMISTVFGTLSFFNFNKAAEALIRRLRCMAFEAILRQDMSWHDVHPPGILTARLGEQIPRIKALVGGNIAGFCQSSLGIFFALGIACIFSWRYTLSVLGVLPVLGFGALLASWAQFENQNLYGGLVSECLTSMKTVTAFDLTPKIMKQYIQILDYQGALEFRASFFYGGGFGMMVAGLFLLLATDVWFANHYVSQGLMTQNAALVVFFCLFSSVMSISGAFVWLGDRTMSALAAMRFFKLIDRKPLMDNLSTDGKEPSKQPGAQHSTTIEFENVCFHYLNRPELQVFEGLSVVFKPKTVTAFVGPSGIGKSTAVALLMRFYDPQHGVIRFNGDDILQLKLSWLRMQMGLVQQEPLLFDGTIFENIKYGCADVKDSDIISAARAANAHGFVCNLPEQYLTVVGQRGAQLSGGQKQRIAIARALVRKPSVFLFDEATAALDTASERQVQAALDELLKVNRHTTLIIAHRLSTIQGADQICVINKGRVEQKGTHQELLKQGGLYSKLVGSQQIMNSKGGILEPTACN